MPVIGVETALPGALNENEPAPAPVLVPATPGGWPNSGLVDGAVPKGVVGALNGDDGAVCPNGWAEGGALPNALFEAAGGAPNVYGVLERGGS